MLRHAASCCAIFARASFMGCARARLAHGGDRVALTCVSVGEEDCMLAQCAVPSMSTCPPAARALELAPAFHAPQACRAWRQAR